MAADVSGVASGSPIASADSWVSCVRAGGKLDEAGIPGARSPSRTSSRIERRVGVRSLRAGSHVTRTWRRLGTRGRSSIRLRMALPWTAHRGIGTTWTSPAVAQSGDHLLPECPGRRHRDQLERLMAPRRRRRNRHRRQSGRPVFCVLRDGVAHLTTRDPSTGPLAGRSSRRPAPRATMSSEGCEWDEPSRLIDSAAPPTVGLGRATVSA